MVLQKLQQQQLQTSVDYHDKYDYPLSDDERNKWQANFKLSDLKKVKHKNKFYFVEGREKIIQIRKKREKYSKTKLIIAQKAAFVLSQNKYILFIGITGSLAMNNAKLGDDIDLMFITKKNRLWIARFLVYLSLIKHGFKVRRPKDNNEKNKLCLNLWLDERSLSFEHKKNEFVAHEVAQVVPIFNKNNIYDKWLFSNKWVLDYWPNVIKIQKSSLKNSEKFSKLNLNIILNLLNVIFFVLQYFYMFPKITNEKVSLKRAEFHIK